MGQPSLNVKPLTPSLIRRLLLSWPVIVTIPPPRLAIVNLPRSLDFVIPTPFPIPVSLEVYDNSAKTDLSGSLLSDDHPDHTPTTHLAVTAKTTRTLQTTHGKLSFPLLPLATYHARSVPTTSIYVGFTLDLFASTGESMQ